MELRGINVSDRVNIYFEHVDAEHSVTILGKPQDTGDCWKLQRRDGTQINVMNFSKMVRVK